ncbi:MAG TPA: protein phosphatase CheZ [Magnetovibrio sp.]
MAKFIRAAKREIAAIRPDDVKDEYLPKAADELDAVVEATADATNNIMDACEVVEGIMGDVSTEVSAKLMDATTRIYEACTFQDITGQRIGKVVVAMKHIEERIDALIGAFGAKSTRSKKRTAKSQPSAPLKANVKEVSDADLLEGPQLGDKAKSQSEIDDLFASFD